MKNQLSWVVAFFMSIALVACGSFSGTPGSPETADGGDTSEVVPAPDGANGSSSADSGTDTGVADVDSAATNTDAGTVAIECDGGAGPFVHSAGINAAGTGNATWTDCVPLGTYNQVQAEAACAAWQGTSVGCETLNECDPSDGPCDTGCNANAKGTATRLPDGEYRVWLWATGGIDWNGQQKECSSSITCCPGGNWN